MRVSTYNTYIHTCLSLRDNSLSRSLDTVTINRINKINNEESLCQEV